MRSSLETVMRPRYRAITPALIFVAAACLAAIPTPTLEWPYSRNSQLPSPDGRHIVYGEPSQRGIKETPELWLRHRGRSDRKLLIRLGSTAKALWFPDSRNFILIDRTSSSGMNSYVYDTEGRITLDMSTALLQNDSDLAAVANGHFYVEAQRLLDPNTLRVAVFGHTDEPPVRCFRFIHSIGRNGEIERLSMRVSPATATACDETSE
jgi:hypothetical protein